MSTLALTLCTLPVDPINEIIFWVIRTGRLSTLIRLTEVSAALHTSVINHPCYINVVLLMHQSCEHCLKDKPPNHPTTWLSPCQYFYFACRFGNPIYKELMWSLDVRICSPPHHAFCLAAEHGQLEVVNCLLTTFPEINLHFDADDAVKNAIKNNHIPVVKFLVTHSFQPLQTPYNFRNSALLNAIIKHATPKLMIEIHATYVKLGKKMDVDHNHLFNVLCHVNSLPATETVRVIEFVVCLYGTRDTPGLFKLKSQQIQQMKDAFRYPQVAHPVLEKF
jgi:hypothetical protein